MSQETDTLAPEQLFGRSAGVDAARSQRSKRKPTSSRNTTPVNAASTRTSGVPKAPANPVNWNAQTCAKR
ncbi:MAG: hypothetical protein R3C44_05170 [Chloroflexota bacterium]